MKYYGTAIVAACLLCPGIGATAMEGTGAMTTASLLWYEEQEAGTDTYPVRVLVNPDHVRFDDGFDASDFVLLERRSRTLFSVSHEEQRILVIATPRLDKALPEHVDLDETREIDSKAPKIAGEQPVHIRFLANDELCYQAIVVPGLLADAVSGLAEYAEILGDRQLDNMHTVPESMQTPCFLARYAYAPQRHLLHGLPLREWDAAGYLRTLTDFSENQPVSSDLFGLPTGYERFQPGQ